MVSFLILLISMIATYVFAMVNENPELMSLVYIQGALFVAAFVMILYRMFTTYARVEVPVGIAEPRKEVLVNLIIKNRGLLPVTRMEALIITEDSYTGEKRKQWMRLGEAARGETCFRQMIMFTATGLYRVQVKKLRVYDVTGMFRGTVRRKSEAWVQVLPKLHSIPVQLSYGVQNFYGEADTYDEHTPGYDNSEIFQVREYHKGDRLQSIHWKLSAKQDELIVKEHALPKACPVVIFLECCPAKEVKRQVETLSYLEVAASLSFSVTQAKCPHYMVWYDGGEQDVKRFRVDDEESLFMFIDILMRIKWTPYAGKLKLLYEEKHRHENYVCGLSLNEKLELRNKDEVVACLSEKDLEQSLRSVELML